MQYIANCQRPSAGLWRQYNFFSVCSTAKTDAGPLAAWHLDLKLKHLFVWQCSDPLHMFAVDKGLSITLSLLRYFSVSVLRTMPVHACSGTKCCLKFCGMTDKSINRSVFTIAVKKGVLKWTFTSSCSFITRIHCRKERGTKVNIHKQLQLYNTNTLPLRMGYSSEHSQAIAAL